MKTKTSGPTVMALKLKEELLKASGAILDEVLNEMAIANEHEKRELREKVAHDIARSMVAKRTIQKGKIPDPRESSLVKYATLLRDSVTAEGFIMHLRKIFTISLPEVIEKWGRAYPWDYQFNFEEVEQLARLSERPWRRKHEKKVVEAAPPSHPAPILVTRMDELERRLNVISENVHALLITASNWESTAGTIRDIQSDLKIFSDELSAHQRVHISPTIEKEKAERIIEAGSGTKIIVITG